MSGINASNQSINLEYSLHNGLITFSKGQLGSRSITTLDRFDDKAKALNENVQNLIMNALLVHQISTPKSKAIFSIDAQEMVSFKVIDDFGKQTDIEIDTASIDQNVLKQIKAFAGTILKVENQSKERSTSGSLSKVTVNPTTKPIKEGETNPLKEKVVCISSRNFSPLDVAKTNAQKQLKDNKKTREEEEEEKREANISDLKKAKNIKQQLKKTSIKEELN
jgi:hypothetical protein